MDSKPRGEGTESRALYPVITDVKTLTEGGPRLCTLFNQMLDQILKDPPYYNIPIDQPQIRDCDTILATFNLKIHPRTLLCQVEAQD